MVYAEILNPFSTHTHRDILLPSLDTWFGILYDGNKVRFLGFGFLTFVLHFGKCQVALSLSPSVFEAALASFNFITYACVVCASVCVCTECVRVLA